MSPNPSEPTPAMSAAALRARLLASGPPAAPMNTPKPGALPEPEDEPEPEAEPEPEPEPLPRAPAAPQQNLLTKLRKIGRAHV